MIKTDELIAAWRARLPVVVGDHYSHKVAKAELWKIFGGKCSYCEIRLASQPGEVEHYRPKKGVRDASNRHVVDPDGKRHPGYFWLAYEWFNLLLSCAACNRVKLTKDGAKHGKGERFPLETDARSFTPEDGVDEEPTLLNPWLDDPAPHFEFDLNTGNVRGRTDRGRKNIDLLGLDREALVGERLKLIQLLKGAYVMLATATVTGDRKTYDEMERLLDAHRAGTESFTALTADLIRDLDAKMLRAFHRVA